MKYLSGWSQFQFRGNHQTKLQGELVKRFHRMTGLIIVGITATMAALLWVVLVTVQAWTAADPSEVQLFERWTVAYDWQAPEVGFVVAAIVLVLALAASVALFERRASNRSRRSSDKAATPLAPKIVMAETRGVFSGPVTVTVLIPAHNEEGPLPLTLSSLASQSHLPERTIVVADNCADNTVGVARAAGAEVFETVENTEKKAGALNQVLRELLPEQGPNDIVMVMDADTRLDDGFLEAAVTRFTHDRALMAVGGLFYGEEGHGLLGQFQRNEYTRYARQIRRRRGRVFVLTGTASMFRPQGLATIAENRGEALPGRRGDVYDTAALTEDNELTIAIKSLGGLMISPSQCTVVTAPALAAWSIGEYWCLRGDPADVSLLGSAARNRLQRDCSRDFFPAGADHSAVNRSMDLVPFLAERRDAFRR